MSDRDSDIKATAEDVAADARRLEEIESEKAGLAADDPRLVSLSEEAERLARRILPKTIAEGEIVRELVPEG